MDIETFKKSRKSAKQAITRIYNWVANNKDTETNKEEFQNREKLLEKAFDKYSKAQDWIEDLDSTNSKNRDEFEALYLSLLSRIQDCIKNLSPASIVKKAQQNVAHVQSVLNYLTYV